MFSDLRDQVASLELKVTGANQDLQEAIFLDLEATGADLGSQVLDVLIYSGG